MNTRKKIQEPKTLNSQREKSSQRSTTNEENKDCETKLKNLAERIGDHYLLEIFKPSNNKDLTYSCNICRSTKIKYKSLTRHILKCDKHERSITKEEDMKRHLKLVEKLTLQKRTRNCAEDESNTFAQGYLEFVGICLKAKLSFRQIHLIATDLKKMYKHDKMGFFHHSNFSEKEISNIINIWGAYLKEELKEDLIKNKFSLCLDCSTMTKTNICAFQIRYLKENKISDKLTINEIKNKVIALKYLEDSSTGETLYQAAKEKLFSLDDKIKFNLVSTVHDHGSNLVGSNRGFVAFLKNDRNNEYFFDLNDPCHSLSLAVSKSLDSLPEEFMNFVEKIHSHFSSTQRVSVLNQLQEKNGLTKLGLSRYVDLRWLSLGCSLQRILKIWDSLKIYMETYEPSKKEEEIIKTFRSLLSDEAFYMKVIFVSAVLDKVNSFNLTFQSQALEIDKLPSTIKVCIKEISELFLDSKEIPQNYSELKNLLWETDDKFHICDSDFVEHLIIELNNKFEWIYETNEEMHNEFVHFCRDYLKALLRWLLYYLPINDHLVQILDFVTIPLDAKEFKKKILHFIKTFKDSFQYEESEVIKEINELVTIDLSWARVEASGSSLKLWSLIDSTFTNIDPNSGEKKKKFPLLSNIFLTAHSLATSSASVEQSFSLIKYLKNDLRNSLSEQTLQSLVLFSQEYKEHDSLNISDELMELYTKMKETSNKTKIEADFAKNDVMEIENKNENLAPKK